MEFKKDEIVKILLIAFNKEQERITEFENEPRDFLHYFTQKEFDLNEYRKIRRNRLWYVASWIQFDLFPNELDGKNSRISYEEYKNEYLKSPFLYIGEEATDLLPIFENKMLEEWKQKLKETQTITLEQKG